MTRRRVTSSLLMIFFLTTFSLLAIFAFVPATVEAATLYVGGIGPGNFTTIQEAVDAAAPGDTVYVFSGTYREDVKIDKSVSLIGENRSTTAILSSIIGSPTVAVTASWVNISHFTVSSGNNSDGIALANVNNVTVKDNIVTGSRTGVGSYLSNDTTISDNIISSNSVEGIYIGASQRFTALNNVMTGNGITVWGERIEEWNSHTIGTSNTLNGKPVYYWKDVGGGTVPNGAGEVILVNVTGVTVEGQDFRNGGSSVLMAFSPGNSVSRNQMTSSKGNAIYVYHSDNSTVVDNTVSDCSWGIYVDHSNGNVIVNNSVSRSDFGIFLHYSHDNNVSKNDARLNSLNSRTAGISLYRSNRNLVDRNTLSSNYYGGIFLGQSIKNRIMNNTALSNQEYDVKIQENSDFSLIVNNTARPAGMHIFSSGNLTVMSNHADEIHAETSDDDLFSKNAANITAYGSRNTITDNIGWIGIKGYGALVSNNTGGISAYGSRHRIDGNNVSNAYVGIYLGWPSDNVTVTGNIGVNTSMGIRTWMVQDVLIANNTFISSNSTGIYLNASSNNRVCNNTIVNSNYGITILWLATNVTLTGNRLQYNNVGVAMVRFSHGNRIHHNDFIYNSRQADDNDTNSWDDGYPSGGNFWSDYTGVDVKSGPSQDLPGSDGIGDTPQNIQGGSNLDRYPLMQPTRVGPWPPSSPRGVQAAPGDAQVTLTWSPPSYDGGSSITNYSIYRGIVPGGETFLAEIGNVLAYTDLGLTNGQKYYYQVTAKNSVGEGARSNEASATPVGGPTVPGAPTNLGATGGIGQIALTWAPPVSNGGSPITNYTLYRGTVSNGETFLTETGNGTMYVDTGLGSGQQYYYKVSAKNMVGEGPQSGETRATTLAEPGPPTGLTAVAGNGQIALSWFPPASNGGSPVTNYVVYRGTAPGGETFLTQLGNVLSYTNAGLVNGQRYYYEVSAKNAVGEGSPSNEASAVPASVPGQPIGLSAVAGDAQVALTWSSPASDGGSAITNYMVYRGTVSDGEMFLVQLGNVLTFVDSGLANGQIYYYKVSAVNAIGEGPLSVEASATPTSGLNPPSEPRNLQAAPGDRQVTLTWTAPASDGGSPITNYVLYRGTVSGGETFLAEIGNLPAYVDAGLTNGQTYYYKVSAKNAAGEGAKSNEATATPTAAPPPNMPPTCNIISPVPDSTVAGTYRIAGIASDVDGNVQKIEVKIDDGAWTEASGSTSWIYDWDTAAFSNGRHSIYARSFDGTNYSTETGIAVNVSNAPPGPQGTSAYEVAFWASLAVVIFETILLLLILLRGRKRRGSEEGRAPEHAGEVDAEREEDAGTHND